MKTPAFDSDTRIMVPCGKLQPYEVSAKVIDRAVVVTSIWIDEAGLLWDFSSQTGISIWNVRPMKWPEECEAVYVLRHPGGTCPIRARNYEQAVRLLIEYQAERDVQLEPSQVSIYSMRGI